MTKAIPSMNIQQLRQSLKLKWVNHYYKNRSWLVKVQVWGTYDGQRRPISGFILATMSVLEPQLDEIFPFILDLNNDPDQIVAALGLNFNPEEQLHLIESDCQEVACQGSSESPLETLCVRQPEASIAVASKPENKPQPNAATTVASKLENKPQPNASIAVASKPENKPQPNASIAVASKPENKPQPNASIAVASKPENKPQPYAAIAVASKPENKPQPNASIAVGSKFHGKHGKSQPVASVAVASKSDTKRQPTALVSVTSKLDSKNQHIKEQQKNVPYKAHLLPTHSPSSLPNWIDDFCLGVE
ncbi:MAG: DUF5331 domain-containing protein [Rhizonema sp. NSF051]|nr:DUF5331 domain-containing protein [Rhizonema sp. NSF051]